MRSRLARVRQHASDATLHAVLIGTIEPDVFADLAGNLATAARSVALAAGENTNLELNVPAEVPELNELNACIDAFNKRAVAYARGETKLFMPVASKLPRQLAMLR